MKSSNHYDVVVVGLGAVGAATLYQLAKRGVRVLGIDRYAPPHDQGSSHGETRISRLAIGEGDEFVPLVRRSHHIWREIEAATGGTVFTQTGGIIMAPRDRVANHHGKADFVRRTIACAERNGIAHEVLDAVEIAKRFPQFRLSGDELGYWERDAGYVNPEAAIAAQLALAKLYGAEIHTNETVTSWDSLGRGASVEISSLIGNESHTYIAGQAVFAAGAWVNQLLSGGVDTSTFSVYRQVMFWFEARGEGSLFTPQRLPIFIWMFGDAQEDYMYGFPASDDATVAFKVASEQYDVTTSPENVERTVSDAEIESMFRRRVRDRIPLATGRCLKARACMYTVTPDRGFVVDRLESAPQVVVASACSGHGFKHSAGVGEAVAQLVSQSETGIDLTPFSLQRYAPTAPRL